LKGMSIPRNLILGCAIVLAAFTGSIAEPQQSTPAAPSKATAKGQGLARIWKSQKTPHEYRVRVENDVFYAEWVNIPPDAAKQGAYIRSECRRAGTKWIGTSRILLPCGKAGFAQGKTINVCRMTLRFEVDSISPERISGRGETLKDFDCARCEIRQTGWGDFVWVPKR
jgi:hypothetical protein